jgi:hypothetical protein
MKNRLKKYTKIMMAALFLLPVFVYAQGSGGTGAAPGGSGTTGSNPGGSGTTGSFIFQNPLKNGTNSIGQLINNIFDAIIQIGLVFVIMAIIYAGLQFVLAQGNDEKLKKAKAIFLYTIIGGVILLGAGAISEVICNTANQFLATPIQC